MKPLSVSPSHYPLARMHSASQYSTDSLFLPHHSKLSSPHSPLSHPAVYHLVTPATHNTAASIHSAWKSSASTPLSICHSSNSHQQLSPADPSVQPIISGRLPVMLPQFPVALASVWWMVALHGMRVGEIQRYCRSHTRLRALVVDSVHAACIFQNSLHSPHGYSQRRQEQWSQRAAVLWSVGSFARHSRSLRCTAYSSVHCSTAAALSRCGCVASDSTNVLLSNPSSTAAARVCACIAPLADDSGNVRVTVQFKSDLLNEFDCFSLRTLWLPSLK